MPKYTRIFLGWGFPQSHRLQMHIQGCKSSFCYELKRSLKRFTYIPDVPQRQVCKMPLCLRVKDYYPCHSQHFVTNHMKNQHHQFLFRSYFVRYGSNNIHCHHHQAHHQFCIRSYYAWYGGTEFLGVGHQGEQLLLFPEGQCFHPCFMQVYHVFVYLYLYS